MSRRFILVVTLAVLPWIGPAGSRPRAAAADAAPAPKIRFDAMTHDFGKIRSDQPQTIRWIYHNDGNAPLTIEDTKPTCGCTASRVEQEAIPPGGKGAIEVRFDPKGMQGSVRKSLGVVSNDPASRVVLLTLRATVTPVGLPTVSGSHPPIAGQSLLMGTCGDCHAKPAQDRTGEALYVAVCAMCHGPRGEGKLAPTLRAADYLASHSDGELRDGIAFGTANPRMPGFSDVMGGPLSAPQIDSLVRLLRSWGPLPKSPPPDRSR